LVTEGRHPMPELDGAEGLMGALQEFRSALRKRSDFSGEWEALERRAGEIGSDLEVFQSGVGENYVAWIERRGRGLFLEACPIDVSGMLRESWLKLAPKLTMFADWERSGKAPVS